MCEKYSAYVINAAEQLASSFRLIPVWQWVCESVSAIDVYVGVTKECGHLDVVFGFCWQSNYSVSALVICQFAAHQRFN